MKPSASWQGSLGCLPAGAPTSQPLLQHHCLVLLLFLFSDFLYFLQHKCCFRPPCLCLSGYFLGLKRPSFSSYVIRFFPPILLIQLSHRLLREAYQLVPPLPAQGKISVLYSLLWAHLCLIHLCVPRLYHSTWHIAAVQLIVKMNWIQGEFVLLSKSKGAKDFPGMMQGVSLLLNTLQRFLKRRIQKISTVL